MIKEESPSLQSRLKVDVGPERIVLTDGLQPFMFRTDSGTLFAQAQLSFPYNYIRPEKNAFPGLPGNVLSRDGGDTWTRWRAAPDQGIGPVIEGAAISLKDGPELIIDWICDGPSTGGAFTGQLWESHDDMATIDGPKPMTVHLPQARGGFDDGGHPYSGVTFHRTILQLPGGDLLASIYCWFAGDDTPCPYQPSMAKFRCVLLRSSDRGRHWRFVSTIAVDPAVGEEGFNEPVMIRLAHGPKAGRLVCLMRTGSNACPIHQSVSDDDGATWSSPQALGFRGVDPDLIEMSDGRLACSFGWRTSSGDGPPDLDNYLIFSDDQGDNWSNLTRLGLEAYSSPFTTCYTSLREIEPGLLLVLYDVGSWNRAVRYVASRRVTVKA
ncbi:MAG: exo-alpha-sialidase [Armatimonadetes bacterium]|nr:exo-alpha-sialidase [Armatimonadota bacterium]